MRKAAAMTLVGVFLVALASCASAGSLSSYASLYLEQHQGEMELVVSRTINWEATENWHLTVSGDVIYRYTELTGVSRPIIGLDVSGTRYWGKMSFTLGGRSRMDQAPRWYVLMTVYH